MEINLLDGVEIHEGLTGRFSHRNCTYPVEESILMDYVPKNTRARWKSLESVSQFGWCGSALAGGLLADKYGYARTCVESNQCVGCP